MFEIRKASRRQTRLRILLSGHSGSGKTYSSLLMAKGLCGDDLSKVVLIDTESGRGDLYSHLGEYNVLRLMAPFTPERYVEAINAAVSFGAEVIIIDSVSHEWEGEGGCLEIKDIESRKPNVSSYTAWANITPRHMKFVNCLIACPAHIISTARTKTAYEMEEYERNGRKMTRPVKIGMATVQRDGFDYEQTLELRMSESHYATTMKDNTSLFDGEVFIPSEETGRKLLQWVESGKPASPEVIALKEEFDVAITMLPESRRSAFSNAFQDAFNANNIERMRNGLKAAKAESQKQIETVTSK